MNSADYMTRDLAPMPNPLRWASMWWFRKGTEHPLSGDELAKFRSKCPEGDRGPREPFLLMVRRINGGRP